MYTVQPGIDFRLYCFHQVTGQCFPGENLSSFLAGTRRLEKKRRVLLGADLRYDGSETRPTCRRDKVDFSLNKGRRPGGCESKGERESR